MHKTNEKMYSNLNLAFSGRPENRAWRSRKHPSIHQKNNSVYWSGADSGQPENFRVHQKLTREGIIISTCHFRVNPKFGLSDPERILDGAKTLPPEGGSCLLAEVANLKRTPTPSLCKGFNGMATAVSSQLAPTSKSDSASSRMHVPRTHSRSKRKT